MQTACQSSLKCAVGPGTRKGCLGIIWPYIWDQFEMCSEPWLPVPQTGFPQGVPLHFCFTNLTGLTTTCLQVQTI